MRIVTFDELPDGAEGSRGVVQLTAFGGFFPSQQIRLLRRSSDSFADYVGVFALEHGEVLGQIFVLRLPYAFPTGPETIGAVAGVGTRPDRARGGIARALLTEVHAREKAAGIAHTALWTNRSWGAHRLYEELGYRDVYFPPSVVRRTTSSRRRPGLPRGVRRGRSTDLPEIDRVHDLSMRGRLGFYRRPRNFARTEARLGNLAPKEALLVVRKQGEIQGYAHVDSRPGRAVCGELVARSGLAARQLVSAVDGLAKNSGLAFQNTPVTDRPGLFPRTDYLAVPTHWYGLMGCTLGRVRSGREAVRDFATEDPRFVCLAGDRF